MGEIQWRLRQVARPIDQRKEHDEKSRCPGCGGSGYYDYNDSPICLECCGTGKKSIEWNTKSQ